MLRLVAVLAVVAGCYSPVYRVQRSARVPHPTVPLHTGQPLAGPVELSVGGSTAGAVREVASRDQAIEVARHQLRGELRVRTGRNGQIALIHERAVGSRVHQLDASQADVGDGAMWAAGLATRYTIAPRGSRFALGLDTEFLRWEVPYVEHRTCVEHCDGLPLMQTDHGSTGEAVVGFGVTPSYRDGRWTVFAGAYVRNHLTIERKGEEYSSYNDEDITGGPPHWTVHAGVAARVGPFSVLLAANQSISDAPLRYGPAIGLSISTTLEPDGVPDRAPSKLEQARERMRAASARRNRL